MGNRKLFYRDIIGQRDVVARLKAFTDLFAETGGTPGHILLTGEEGMGKASLAVAVANERDVGLQEADAAKLEIMGDFTALVTSIRENQVLFLSNIHRLRNSLAIRLPRVLREGRLEFAIGQGPGARTHIMPLKPFTLIGTCPKKSDCSPDLLREFSLVLNLGPYSDSELQALAQSIANAANLSLEPRAAALVAKICGVRPSGIEATLSRLRRAINKSILSEGDVERALSAFGINVSSEKPSDGTENLQNLSGQEFEALISSLLTRMGFHAELTKTSGDGGIDIVAVLNKPIFGGRYLFQCKRFAPENLVGAPAIRDFYGAVTADRVARGIFITTSDFTAQAREFGQKAGVELIDVNTLQGLLLEYGMAEPQSEDDPNFLRGVPLEQA